MTTYTVIIGRDADTYVAFCPELDLDIASQGVTMEEVKSNPKEAVELFVKSADADEIERWTSA